jgi:hypothetical protein
MTKGNLARLAGSRLGLLTVLAFALAGCAQTEPYVPTRLQLPAAFTAPSRSLIPRARAALRAGHRLEHEGSDESVDQYYRSAVYSYAAITVTAAVVGTEHPDALAAREIYNEALRDCLRAALHFGRLDARSHLLVNTPAGAHSIPIAHRGFVWKPEDFNRVVDPTRLDRNPNEHGADSLRPGLGAELAVARVNPQVSLSDRFLPREAAFNATALLRPDLGAWLGGQPGAPADVLELYDPLRVATVAAAGRTYPLAANFGAANALAYKIAADRGPFALAGFALPSTVLDKANIRMIEPYQPGKIPLVLVHGLVTDPFIYNDIIITLNRTPGFLDRYQVWVFPYPTGITFLRSAALLRSGLRDALGTCDPAGSDPALRNMVLVGYSMGGLLCKLQVTSSGDHLWAVAANRPLESLVTSDRTRGMMRELFYFEPLPMIRRVIFIATPHDGSPVASTFIGRLATQMVQRPSDAEDMMAQIKRDNPGAVRPFLLRRVPSSIDLLDVNNPLLPAMRRLVFAPGVSLHTIAGHGIHPPGRARGDLVVPLPSAHLDEAVSEHWVAATHINIYYQPETIAEVQRILAEHAAVENSPVAASVRLPIP